MEERYTSRELSKKLSEGGCELKSKYYKVGTDYYLNHCWYNNNGKIELTDDPIYSEDYDKSPICICVAYDILNDICCRYAIQFFGDEKCNKDGIKVLKTTKKEREKWDGYYKAIDGSSNYYYEENDERLIPYYEEITNNIFKLIQQGKKQEAESYIIEHSVFTKNKKEE